MYNLGAVFVISELGSRRGGWGGGKDTGLFEAFKMKEENVKGEFP